MPKAKWRLRTRMHTFKVACTHSVVVHACTHPVIAIVLRLDESQIKLKREILNLMNLKLSLKA